MINVATHGIAGSWRRADCLCNALIATGTTGMMAGQNRGEGFNVIATEEKQGRGLHDYHDLG